MARRTTRPDPIWQLALSTLTTRCPQCGGPLWAADTNYRTVITLDGPLRLAVQVRRCRTPDCPGFGQPVRPEAEARTALPEGEFGLDLIATVGALRYTQHRSIPEIDRELTSRGVAICQRSVTNLLDRYDELLTLSLADPERLRHVTGVAGRVVLAIDGMQPDVGHEVLGILRDCLSGEILLARSLLSSGQEDLAHLVWSKTQRDCVGKAGFSAQSRSQESGFPTQSLIREVRGALKVPIVGAIANGQDSIRKAVAKALPGVPHQLGQFPYLREAAQPIFEADRHAKTELKKRVRGVRPIERTVAGRDDPEAVVIRGSCAAVRRSLTDDGRPPLVASGLMLKGRRVAVVESLDRVEEKRGYRPR